MDGHRITHQQAHFVEEGPVLRTDGNGQQIICINPHTGKGIASACFVILHTKNGLILLRIPAKLSDFLCHAQQDGKRIILGIDNRTIRILQIMAEGKQISAVSLSIIIDGQFINHCAVCLKIVIRTVPLNQMIAIDQCLYIQIGRVIPPHGCGEMAVHCRGMANHKPVFIHFFGEGRH